MPAWNAAAQAERWSAGTDGAPRPRLGELLVARGALSPPRLRGALAAQRASGARLGEVLLSRGLVRPAEIAGALARQRGLPLADPGADPPDPALVAAAPLAAIAAWRALPWRRDPDRPGGVILVTPEPDRAAAEAGALRRAFGLPPDTPLGFAVCARPAFDAALLALPAERRARRAAARPPARLSVRSLARPGPRLAGLALLALAAAAPVAAPDLALPALFLAAAAITAVNLGLRLAALATQAPRRRAAGPAPAGAEGPADPARAEALLPSVTLIVALYREPEAVAGLVRALEALDYPAERLQVLLALEEGDGVTRAAVAAARPPPWMRVIPTPPGAPRTKPRALNHALDFATGALVGVYDAEDRPEPGQLRRVAEAFARAPARTACLQARLGFHNARAGWLTRCFAMEYATWFHLILPALIRFGFPAPLGGASLFVRRRVLERLGAWDAWNVTEDADLGIRLARAGYATGMVDSETAEEAVGRPWAWIRQRSRWQKGYMQTWLCHMRDPARLWRDLGPRGFAGFQILFLGAAAPFLAQPLLWGAWVWWALAADGWALLGVSGGALAALVWTLHLGQLAMLATTAEALRRAGRGRLAPWALSLPLYWPLSAVSALKGLAELVIAPAWWDKTSHGPGTPGAAGAAARRRAMAGLTSPSRPSPSSAGVASRR